MGSPPIRAVAAAATDSPAGSPHPQSRARVAGPEDRAMIVDEQLFMAVIYHNPSDFPGLFVGRYHKIGAGTVTPDPEPFAVAPTLDEVRRAMSPGNDHRLATSPDDDPTIVEVWV